MTINAGLSGCAEYLAPATNLERVITETPGTNQGDRKFYPSLGWSPVSKNVGEFFSQRERGSIMGFWCTNYALGGFFASILAGKSAEKFGWRYAFLVPAGVLLVIWVLFILFQRNRPEDLGLPP